VNRPYFGWFPRQDSTVSGIALTLFGSPAVAVPESAAGIPLGSKSLALLAFLVLEPGSHSREELAALLWGEHPDEQARASLRQTLTHLRAALGESLRITRASGL
jgi:DNA-binding SARP family transcriptional activator